MLALIAGQGALPGAVVQSAPERPLICALDHALPDSVAPDHVFRLEKLGRFLRWLKAQGVTQVCFCGSMRRPSLDWRQLELSTLWLLPRILRALGKGDDGALRIAINLFETIGIEVVAAHEAAPHLLPDAGVPTLRPLSEDADDMARHADRISDEQGRQDLGQSCVIGRTGVVEREDAQGTDAMLARLGSNVKGGVFYKAPKPGQDRRADLPVIGPDTAQSVARAGLSGIVIEAGGVMVLNFDETLRRLDAEGLFLWVRERPE